MKSTAANWRKWAFYGALIAAAYTAQDTYADLATKPVALYVGKFIGSIVAGAILGSVAAMVRNKFKNNGESPANPENPA